MSLPRYGLSRAGAFRLAGAGAEKASWLPALFADPILFPCSGSRQGRRRAGGRQAGSLLSPRARVASPCSHVL